MGKIMNRQKQLWWLIGLTAVTLIPTYALQGWLASGHTPKDVHIYFWYAESIAWAIRALVEAWAIIFLFKTRPATSLQEYLLWGFKVALITLITLTVGPVMLASGRQETIQESLHLYVFVAWNFAIASYAPLMLGAVGVAYKIQSEDEALPATLQKTLPRVKVAPVKPEEVAPETVKVASVKASEVALETDNLSPEDRKQIIITTLQVEPKTSQAELSRLLGVSRPTVKNDLQQLSESGMLEKNGAGWKVNGK